MSARPMPCRRAARSTITLATSARCRPFSRMANSSCALPTTVPTAPRAANSTRAPASTSPNTVRQYAAARSGSSGGRNPSDAPESTASASNPTRSASAARASSAVSASTSTPTSADRAMHGDELGAVGEGALHLHLLDHLRHALHHVVAAEDVEARGHQLGDRTSVTDPLEDLGGDDRQGLGVVQLEAAGSAASGKLGRGED